MILQCPQRHGRYVIRYAIVENGTHTDTHTAMPSLTHTELRRERYKCTHCSENTRVLRLPGLRSEARSVRGRSNGEITITV